MDKFAAPDQFDENPEWTEATTARSRPAAAIHSSHVVAALVRRRGLQVAPTKQQVTLRLDPDVLAKFRATGRGWQARINAVLKAAEV